MSFSSNATLPNTVDIKMVFRDIIDSWQQLWLVKMHGHSAAESTQQGAHLPLCSHTSPAPLSQDCPVPVLPSSRRCPDPEAGPEQTSSSRAGPFTAAYNSACQSRPHMHLRRLLQSRITPKVPTTPCCLTEPCRCRPNCCKGCLLLPNLAQLPSQQEQLRCPLQ